jgi:ABC-type amino acid transport system permease subunit
VAAPDTAAAVAAFRTIPMIFLLVWFFFYIHASQSQQETAAVTRVTSTAGVPNRT